MAPSTRTRKPLGTRQQPTAVASTKPLILGKVSKSTTSVGKHNKISESQKIACEQVVVERQEQKEAESRARVESRQRSSIKRKRNQSHHDDEDEDEDSFVLEQRTLPAKKTKLQLLTPPHSQHNTDNESLSPVKRPKFSLRQRSIVADLPEGLQHLASLHDAFLKAFSLHEAHNGSSVPAEIVDFMMSMTRLWKKASVTQVDIQRMLAIYEMETSPTAPSAVLDQFKSPFKLVTSGLGFNVRTNIESCCTSQINPSDLQSEYEQKLVHVFDMSRSDSTSFVHCSYSAYPLLAIRIGTQTQARRQKMSSVRAEILSRPTSAQTPASSDLDLSKLSISDQMMDMTPVNVKSRTLSLFDRVRAKGVANSATSAATPAQLTRRHAIGRIPEIVEFLRMKQSQKSSHSSSILSLDDLDDGASSASSSSTRARNARRVSFSLTQIIREVRESVAVPVSAEEVSVVITILATELPELGGWVKVFTKGCVVSVTLDGAGIAISGREVGLLIEQKEQKR